MLFERHNPSDVVGIDCVQSAPNAFIGNSGNVRRVGENATTFQNNIEEAVSNFDFRRDVKQLTHLMHCESPCVFSKGQDVTSCKVAQSALVVNFSNRANIFTHRLFA
jgi:hypothetical protein